MAGPTVAILVSSELTEHQRRSIHSYVRSLANKVEGKDFWVEGRPFILVIGPEVEGELTEYEDIILLGVPLPRDIVGICAMCNSSHDHEILGAITEAICLIVGGHIAFGSPLQHYTSAPEMLEHPGLMEFNGQSIISLELFQRWRQHVDFRMAK
jgi:hypothetical protein